MYLPKVQDIVKAYNIVRHVVKPTPLDFDERLSNIYNASIYLKREDLTPVRSYKLRGAYNKMYSLHMRKSVSTCSAGNHAQGVAYSCRKLGVQGNIYMPTTTPKQKIDKVKLFGGDFINIFLEGDTFDDSYAIATKGHSNEVHRVFIHPFDDPAVIEGQATVGLEILEQIHKIHNPIDYVVLPIGGGGLCAGVSAYIKALSSETKIIGVEPLGAPSMTEALKQNKVVKLEKISTFVDGASVKAVGALTFPICKKYLDDLICIDEGHICSKIIEMYNEHGWIVEPAGVLSLCALDKINIEGKTVVAILSGGNSDASRMPDFLSMASSPLQYSLRSQQGCSRPNSLSE